MTTNSPSRLYTVGASRRYESQEDTARRQAAERAEERADALAEQRARIDLYGS